MSTSTTYPNGQTLVSSALTPAAISTLLQQLTYGMLGLVYAPSDGKVRVDWQQQGEPYQDATQDVCYVACVPEDDRYSRVRNLTTTGALAPEPSAEQTWTYTRAWTVTWHFYGPNATDRARMVHTALFMDYFSDALAGSNLFAVTDYKEPQRAPVDQNAQWWEHALFEASMYENVTETIAPGVVTSAEVKVYDENDQNPTLDITVSAA